ncbi:MAG: DNA-binding response regulator [Bacteroidetes bacterium]|nr:MAG: DNA-binding response regulator [Bacteroidota bacterium]
MINALLINGDFPTLNSLKNSIDQNCPTIKICGLVSNYSDINDLMKEFKPQLLFIEKGKCKNRCIELLKKLNSFEGETIIVADEKEFAFNAINFRIGSYLLKPIDKIALVNAVQKANKRLDIKREQIEKKDLLDKIFNNQPGFELIGIPTIDGLEFISVNEIIKCEGLQSYTRIVTIHQSCTISSNNIGEIAKMLGPYGFFTPHKSYLINLNFLKKYHREGIIILQDGSQVPLARRRKLDFLKRIKRL